VFTLVGFSSFEELSANFRTGRGSLSLAIMSIVGQNSTKRPRAGFGGFVDRLSQHGGRFVAERPEGRIVLSSLAAFVVLWMVFDIVSLASVDAHPDVSEASLWAQNFAFGYKHPPMTAWLYSLWFALLPRQDWAADLLNVTVVACGLAVSWRLLRDHLDKNRALFGLIALVLIPLYDIKTALLNANTVIIQVWAPPTVSSPAPSQASRFSASTGPSFLSPASRWRPSPAPVAGASGAHRRHT
jgi:hypothetical protein